MPSEPDCRDRHRAARMAEIRAGRDAASGDLVELRLDGVVDLDVAGGAGRPPAPGDRHVPRGLGGRAVRRQRSGTRWRIFGRSHHARRRVRRRRVAGRARRPCRRRDRTELVAVASRLRGMPADSPARVRAMRRPAPTAVVKVAVRRRRLARLRDRSARRHADRRAARGHRDGAGRTAVARLCPRLFGSRWTYGGDARRRDRCRVDDVAGRLSRRPSVGGDGALRRRRAAARALGVARHAQRGVWRHSASMRSTCRSRRPTPTSAPGGARRSACRA